jgi:hypothetical protein
VQIPPSDGSSASNGDHYSLKTGAPPLKQGERTIRSPAAAHLPLIAWPTTQSGAPARAAGARRSPPRASPRQPELLLVVVQLDVVAQLNVCIELQVVGVVELGVCIELEVCVGVDHDVSPILEQDTWQHIGGDVRRRV